MTELKTIARIEKKREIYESGDEPLAIGALKHIILRILQPDVKEVWMEKFAAIRAVTIFFETRCIYNDDFNELMSLTDYGYADPTDGHPRFELSVKAKDNVETYIDQHSWMEKSQPDEWLKVKEYVYDGTMTIEIELTFSENDWNKMFPPEETKGVE
jgi:hypothetical protein